jgi:membrane protein YqaA with SNARE-associated domain
MNQSEKKYPKGHFMNRYMGLSIAICAGLGVSLSFITDNLAFIGVGPAIGAAVGVALGQSMEDKYSRKGLIRPLTEKETTEKKKTQKYAFWLLLAGILLFLFFVVYLNL